MNDLVSIADANDLDLSTGMTLEAWVYPSSVGSWRSMVFKTNGTNDLAYALYAFSDGTNTPRGFVNLGGSQQEVTGGTTLAANVWSHVATTYDGSSLRVYVNGSEVGQRTLSGSILATTGALELGGNTAYGTEWFAGLLDDVRVYNRALSASEIVADRDTAVAQATPVQNQQAVTGGQRAAGSGQAATTADLGSRDWGVGAAPASAASRVSPNPQPHTRASLPDPDSPIFTSFGKALLRQLQQSISTTTRTISYDYDGLQRLTSASETPGTNQTYSYDLAGNRTGVWVNGTRTQNYTYNAANQVTGWSYDAAGNLLTDGSQSYTYDALGRVLTVGNTTNQSNADGTLVAQTQGSTTTRYTQDLAAPLSQILSDGTQRYVYGNPAERLFAQSGTNPRTWYSVDALGSVRATLNDTGIPQNTANYDAWGVPETPLLGSFGFTGELQRGSDVWLRARWYGAGRGGFGSRDPYAGNAQTPYSLMYYQYGYSAPTMWTDPSGRDPGTPPSFMFCNQSPCPGWEPCTAFDIHDPHPNPNPCSYSTPLPQSSPPTAPQRKPWGYPVDIGVVFEVSGTCGVGIGGNAGANIVFDLYDFESNVFGYGLGPIAFGASLTISVGLVWGWSTYRDRTVDNYKGLFTTLGVGVGPASVQGGASQITQPQGRLWTASIGVGVSIGFRASGTMLGQFLHNLAQSVDRMDAIGLGGIGYTISPDDLHLPSSKRVFHQPNGYPTHRDAQRFKHSIAATLLPISTLFLGTVMELDMMIDYNQAEWQKQADYYRLYRRTYQ